jgi:hypothetical protein
MGAWMPERAEVLIGTVDIGPGGRTREKKDLFLTEGGK